MARNNHSNYGVHVISPTIDAATDYVSGDVLFAPTEISNIFDGSSGSVKINSVSCFDKAGISAGFVLYFTYSSTALGTINETADAADGTLEEIQATVPIVAGDWRAGANFTDNGGFCCLTNPATDGIGAILQGNNWAETSRSSGIHVSAIMTTTANFTSTSDLLFKIGVQYL